MNREYNCKVSSKNSKRLLKNLQNTVGDYFFLPHPVDCRCVTNTRCVKNGVPEPELLTTVYGAKELDDCDSLLTICRLA